MTESQQSKGEDQKAKAGSQRRAGLVVASIAVVAVAAVAGINAGWLAALTGDRNGADPIAENTSPEIVSLAGPTERIEPGAEVTLTCVAIDEDDDAIAYVWTASDGTIVGDGPEVQWSAPETEGLFRVFVRVEDGKGGAAEQSLPLRVRANTPPEILVMRSEVSEEIGWVVPGARVHVSCEVVDAEGDSVSYAWAATMGEVFGEGSAIIWIAPDTLGMQWVTVRVTDVYGAMSERSIPITINVAQPPEIRGFDLQALDTDMFKPYGDSWRIFKERSCAIQAIVDDPEGDYDYRWTAELGTITADGPNAVWKSPNSKGWVTIVVMVSDKHGSESSASIRLYVETCPSCI